MKKYKNNTLNEYLNALAKKEPVPGGGSAAAMTAAMGAGLISMVAGYSKGKGATKTVEKKVASIRLQAEKARKRFLELVDLDAQAYMGVVKTRKKSIQQKKAAERKAKKICLEICKLSYKVVQLTPYLVKNGNKNLLGDIEVAVELLLAAFNASSALLKT